jgi:hypothetical protein
MAFKRAHLKSLCTVTILAGLTLSAAESYAGPREQAYRIFNRLNGYPPSAEKLSEMEGMVAGGNLKDAALAAINDANGGFYNLTLKTYVARWTNRDKTPRVALNDFTATIIGMVRDDVPFTEALSSDILYTGNVTGAPAYSLANNQHYQFLDDQSSRLHEVLQKTTQSSVNNLPPDAIAGVMSTRGWAEAYYNAGTNRRAMEASLEVFLCRSMESLNDTTRSDFRVRKDVTRAPGGDSALFRNRCAGCHSGMDALGGAFAYYDWDDTTAPGTMIYTAGQVRAKMTRNASEFPAGFQTTDDSWMNNWLEGQNSKLGWKGDSSGNGAKSLGAMLAQSDAFGSCMAKRAFEIACLHKPGNNGEEAAVAAIAASVAQGGYSFKQAVAAAAAVCIE